MKLGVVILAAGQGTRMRSTLPKVLHCLAGRPLLRHVVDTAAALSPERSVVVFGHGGAQVREAMSDCKLTWVEQAEQLGTGHAVAQALPSLENVDQILVLYGDVPLIKEDTLTALVQAGCRSDLALLTAKFDDPTGYGRIVRDSHGRVESIVEQKDASPNELKISEINTGFLVAKRECLVRWLANLSNDNAQGEYYLTDIVKMAVDEGVDVHAVYPNDTAEVMGVNDRIQLAALERHYQVEQAENLMRKGVTLSDPHRFDLRGNLTVGQDVEFDANVLIEGEVSLGSNVRIGVNSVIRNSRIADGVRILENCVIENADIGPECRIGPFARIRPDTKLAGNNHIGNFVEIKKSDIAEGSKINHLSYIGDTSIGKSVNIGAGTITCNYDGVNKHRTVIGDNAFIGSDSQLVAPVEIGAGATIGAGSTITTNAPADTLTVSRTKQVSLKSWRRPQKKPKA